MKYLSKSLDLTIITECPNISILTATRTLSTDMVTCLVYTMSTTTFSAFAPKRSKGTCCVK